ncbi:hypothetical protein QAD02_003474 [Eretmocerus hayati]|uniref:Uncharacterized protein n=1 Tax=Eretmocerus hayati TaxID=131215 RepID=A0ACC2NM03_9HYME|nr:hypothetical protein QAD02_003474 [Eretmocerus hayati]
MASLSIVNTIEKKISLTISPVMLQEFDETVKPIRTTGKPSVHPGPTLTNNEECSCLSSESEESSHSDSSVTSGETLPLRPRPTKTSQQRAENARKQSISDSSSATSRAPPKRGRKKGSKIELPERPTNMSGGQGDLDGSTIAKRLRIRKGGPRTQVPILKSSRETTRDSSESLTSSDESEDQEFEEPPIPQRDKSFLPDLLDKGEESNSTNQSSELSDTEERKILAFSTTLTQLDTSRPIPDEIPSTSYLDGIFQVSTPSNNPLHSETNGDTNDTLGSDIDKQSREGLAHPVPMLVELTSPMEQESSDQDHEFDESESEIMEDPLAQDDLDTTGVCDSGTTKRGPFNAEEIRLQRKREMNRLRQEILRKRKRKELQNTISKPCHLCGKLHTEHPTQWAACTRCRKTFAGRKCLAGLGLESFQCKTCMTSKCDKKREDEHIE